jgi:NAD(P)-dependent dehydrogenase (short-subunit alcohol dehydrogenase family)
VTRVLAVTGAAGGIGRAVVLAAAREGWSVAALDIDLRGALRVADEARAAGAHGALGIECDVTLEASVREALRLTHREFGGLDSVLANAGVERNASLTELTLESWEAVLAVNLTGAFLTCKHAARIMTEHSIPGSIVCVSSPSAFVGFAGGSNAAYGSSKGGVSAFVRAAALDSAPNGIRVNAIVPGATDTPLLYVGLDGVEREQRVAEIARDARDQIPLGRLAEPFEVANAALWLLGADSSYVTGSNLVCDGGLLAKSANNF